jgi:hypothetical protein
MASGHIHFNRTCRIAGSCNGECPSRHLPSGVNWLFRQSFAANANRTSKINRGSEFSLDSIAKNGTS